MYIHLVAKTKEYGASPLSKDKTWRQMIGVGVRRVVLALGLERGSKKEFNAKTIA